MRSQDETSSKTKSKLANPPLWDVIVIGGGPSGMMAAGRAAELGAKVLIVEKNETLGKKLLITGGGRCNVTNSEFDTRILLSKFKDSGKFLFSTFSQYGVKETLDFFHAYGMETKVENEKRTFPISDKAASVLEVLVTYITNGYVTILSNTEVTGIIATEGETSTTDKKIASGIRIRKEKTTQDIFGKKIILATGGKSRPDTGSTGDGFVWAKKLGHTVVEPSASLVPITVYEAKNTDWYKNLSGISLPEVKISIFQNNIRQHKPIKGKILFTHTGLSGPAILNLSQEISELLKYGDTFISIDVLPTIDQATLDSKLNTLFRTEINKKLKNCLGMIGEIPTALIKAIITFSGVDGETPAHSITKENRRKIASSLKDFRLQASGLLGVDKAIVTSGGVLLDEIDPRTMRSQICSNLYLIGDMLHIDRPSGGYSLQLCWTTGYVAGNDAGKSILQ